MSNLSEIRKWFSNSIFAKATAIKSLSLTPKEMARMKESITDDIRKYTDLTSPGASFMAKMAAEPLGVDLTTLDWQHQSKIDENRGLFHYEHYHTVKSIRDKCIKALRAEEIESILKLNGKVVWILKEENRKLNSLGYKSDRPDPAMAYREAGITIEWQDIDA